MSEPDPGFDLSYFSGKSPETFEVVAPGSTAARLFSAMEERES